MGTEPSFLQHLQSPCYNHDSDWRQSVLLRMGEVMCVTLYEKLSLLIAALTLAVEITILLLSV